jgi:hypothetical protein
LAKVGKDPFAVQIAVCNPEIGVFEALPIPVKQVEAFGKPFTVLLNVPIKESLSLVGHEIDIIFVKSLCPDRPAVFV